VGRGPPAGDLGALHARARAIEAAGAVLREWLAAALPGPKRLVHEHVACGRLPVSVVDFATGGGYDLVACGTHARATQAALLGSVAEALLDARARAGLTPCARAPGDFAQWSPPALSSLTSPAPRTNARAMKGRPA